MSKSDRIEEDKSDRLCRRSAILPVPLPNRHLTAPGRLGAVRLFRLPRLGSGASKLTAMRESWLEPTGAVVAGDGGGAADVERRGAAAGIASQIGPPAN